MINYADTLTLSGGARSGDGVPLFYFVAENLEVIKKLFIFAAIT